MQPLPAIVELCRLPGWGTTIVVPNDASSMTADTALSRNSIRSARIALVTLTAINLLNYLDRYLIAGIIGPLKEHFNASDADIGLLTSVFLVTYMIAAPIFGALAQSMSRTLLLAGGVLIWSMATMGSGLTNTLIQLLILRALVGVGEAAYTTVGPALLVDHYQPARRPLALSIFYAAIPVGTALSYIASGVISQHWGWRAVFLAGGMPGLALAIICFYLHDPTPGQSDVVTPASQSKTQSPSRMKALATLARNQDFLIATGGYIAFTFAFGALAVWMPYYLQKVQGWSVEKSTITFGMIVVISGLLGTLGGGWVAQKMGGSSRSCMKLCGICMAIAAPTSLVALYCDNHVLAMTGLFISSLFSFATQGPVNAVILNSVTAPLRPYAVGSSVLLIHALGDVPSPWLIGVISDSAWGMPISMSLIPIAMAISCVIWLIAGRRC